MVKGGNARAGCCIHQQEFLSAGAFLEVPESRGLFDPVRRNVRFGNQVANIRRKEFFRARVVSLCALCDRQKRQEEERNNACDFAEASHKSHWLLSCSSRVGRPSWPYLLVSHCPGPVSK